MEYVEIDNTTNLKDTIDQLNSLSFYTDSYKFLLADNLVIYGYFKDSSTEYGLGNLFVFGKTIKPNEIVSSPSKSIFTKLKQYGSSSKYKGLLNYKGEIILPNIYDDIHLFAYNRLLIEKNGKFGVIDTDGNVLAEPKYGQIVDAWEYTIGVVLNGKVGFMDINCNIIIEPKYCLDSIDNNFHDGLIVVSEIIDEFKYQYCIDHYGLIHGNIENITPEVDYEPPYEDYINDNEYSDPLDAYDGDSDARWNTD
ncbi:WG repeat-containing protein [Bacteroides acidifaciens]|uniref:WG repeat-containing protein n=1 Tax=Bacteroides acidifaciens TaxID=85831 RepID=UPI0026EDC0CA|nr:WG repeat-containing protein [Bacteroides acidifaciens]